MSIIRIPGPPRISFRVRRRRLQRLQSGLWAGRGGPDSRRNSDDGTTTSLPRLDICSFADQKVTADRSLLAGPDAPRQLDRGSRRAQGIAIENTAEGSDTQKDDAVTYRAGLMYEFASGFTPYVSYGEFFVPVVGRPRRPGGDRVRSSSGRMYEVGFKYQPTGARVDDKQRHIRHRREQSTGVGSPRRELQGADWRGIHQGLRDRVTGQVTGNLKVVGGYRTRTRNTTTALRDGQLELVPEAPGIHVGRVGVRPALAQGLVGWSRRALHRRLLG